MRKVTIGCIFLCFLFLVGCSNENDKNTSTINTPDKIIVYREGNQKEIEKENPNFNKIVKITNDRIDKKNISVVKDAYVDSSRGPLKSSKDILNIVE